MMGAHLTYVSKFVAQEKRVDQAFDEIPHAKKCSFRRV
jgi:hypothetical protein